MFRIWIVTAIGLALCTPNAGSATPRVWRGYEGRFEVDASIVGYGEKSIKLQSGDSEPFEIPIAKLSEKDRLFYERLKKTAFRIQGVGSISAPNDTHKWIFVKNLEADNIVAGVYGCISDTATSKMILTVSPQIAMNDPVRISHLKGYFNGMLGMIQETGLQPVDAVQPTLEGRIPNAVQYMVIAKRPDGSQVEVHGLTVFSDKRTYVFQAVAEDSETAQELLSAATTLFEE